MAQPMDWPREAVLLWDSFWGLFGFESDEDLLPVQGIISAQAETDSHHVELTPPHCQSLPDSKGKSSPDKRETIHIIKALEARGRQSNFS